jgi:nickel-dependent lactate racemase
LTGLIEPHLMAGFAGGPKVVLPGLAGVETILHNHGARMMSVPTAIWGITTGNPLWEEMHEVAKMTSPTFMMNVTLNKDRAITGVFAGELDVAHTQGVEFVKNTVMRSVAKPFDIVITTNAGYPLDLNLLQSMKGVAAAWQIVKQGGSIVAAVECSKGIPEHGNYKSLLQSAASIHEALHGIANSDETIIEQWVVQAQAKIQQWADVYVYSSLPANDVRACHLTPIASVEECVRKLLKKYGADASIAVLPEGPQTIPYLK